MQHTEDNIVDVREYDVPYYLRVAIDDKLFVGYWYTVKVTHGNVIINRKHDKIERAETVVMGTLGPTSARHQRALEWAGADAWFSGHYPSGGGARCGQSSWVVRQRSTLSVPSSRSSFQMRSQTRS